MALSSSGLETFIIHYSPLVERLRAQQHSLIWQILKPTVITERCCLEEAQYFPHLRDLNASLKAEAMAQVSEIIHILALHSKAIKTGNRQIQPARLIDSIPLSDLSLVHEFYLQAIAAYSRSNYELTLQHLHALRLFLRSGKDYCLILEDDSVSAYDNPQLLEKELKHCLLQVHILNHGFFDISSSLGFRPMGYALNNPPSRSFVEMTPGQTRCSASYLLSKKIAHILLEQQDNIVLPVDWHISYMLSRFSISTFWYTHPIFDQGSEFGSFSSNQYFRNSGGDSMFLKFD